MPPSPCAICATNRAMILRPKNHQKLCRDCFITVFEEEIHRTIISTNLFQHGERVAIGASGGKDSTVLASVLKTLNQRYDYGLDLVLLSIDEGIKGYRDDSLETVKRNAQQYDLPLTIIGYDELYGWTMDQVVEQVGKKGNCTYCGVFRRQALDRGAARLGVEHVVTGHNADDVAETVLMNLLRGDLPRLSRTTSIVTSSPSGRAGASANPVLANIKRSKPLKYAYEKEIVLYAHHKKLDYFSTECIYSPEAFRGSARTLVKNLERVRPSAILDIVRSGEDMAPLVPGSVSRRECLGSCQKKNDVPKEIPADEEETGGCGTARDHGSGGEMARMERKLQHDEAAQNRGLEVDITNYKINVAPQSNSMQNGKLKDNRQPVKQTKQQKVRQEPPRKGGKQTMGQCSRCGYISSQAVCKACMLLEGLNKNRPKTAIGITNDENEAQESQRTVNKLKKLDLAGD